MKNPPPRKQTDPNRRYARNTLQNAQTLRREHTDAEGLLWARLRDKGLGARKFRRQQPIGPYIADFACMSEKLRDRTRRRRPRRAESPRSRAR